MRDNEELPQAEIIELQTLRDEIKNANDAELVLNSDSYTSAWQMIEREFIERLLACDLKDDQGRRVWQEATNVLRATRRFLEETMQSGELAQSRLEELEKMANHRHRFSRSLF